VTKNYEQLVVDVVSAIFNFYFIDAGGPHYILLPLLKFTDLCKIKKIKHQLKIRENKKFIAHLKNHRSR
jgi:hypothetical protein